MGGDIKKGVRVKRDKIIGAPPTPPAIGMFQYCDSSATRYVIFIYKYILNINIFLPVYVSVQKM